MAAGSQIVVAIDAEERTRDALAVGRVLAGATGAPVRVVTVFAYLPLADPDGAELTGLRDEARRTLTELAAESGLERAAVDVIAGNVAARTLQHLTEQSETGLIVVGSTMRGPVGRLLVGGVGERLLAGAACPVAIAPRGYADVPPTPLRRIGVGLDGSEEAQRALDAAAAIATRAGAELVVVTAFQPLAFGATTTGALPGPSADDALRAELRATHDAALASAGAAVTVSGRFADGSADDVLLDQSEALDLLVVGSRGYGPLGAVLMGSTTSALARGAACPLLVTPRGTHFDLLG